MDNEEWSTKIEDLSQRYNGNFRSFCFAVIYYIRNFKMAVRIIFVTLNDHAMASISFGYSEGKLVLCHTPVIGLNDITKRLDTEDSVSIKHTFWVRKDLLCEGVEDDSY